MHLLITLMLCVGLIAVGRAADFAVPDVTSKEKDLLAEILEVFEQEALGGSSPTVIEALGIEELLETLREFDPYIAYHAAGQARTDSEADERGFGLLVSEHEGQFLVTPAAAGPAVDAGIEGPALLETIDGVSVTGMRLADAERAFARAGDFVTVDLRTSPLFSKRYTLRRGKVITEPVQLVAGDRFVLLRINSFASGETASGIREALESLEERPELLVLDLRLNVGGSLFEALDAASLFLQPGLPLAVTRDAAGRTTEFVTISTGADFNDLPVVILTSRHTVSAAEAFVRALQGYARALVIGTPTFGKCRSQRRLALSGGGDLSVTNLIVFDLEGRDCEGRPVAPDLALDRLDWLRTELAVARAHELLGNAGAPTVLCLEESDALDRIELRVAQARVLFPALNVSFYALPLLDRHLYRVCIGPFRGARATHGWADRLKKGNFADALDLRSFRSVMLASRGLRSNAEPANLP